jgi:limonene 1,2-monooxygenase
MEFGIFSNGFRPHTTAAQTYQDDIDEIVLADKLGFRDVFISEHHGEAPYINRVDTIPAPEFMMCKLAALTKNIRMGAAVKLLHLHHPLDIAVQAATIEHLVGEGRFIFGFGSGFPHPQASISRGLTFDDRHSRLRESLDVVLKCWAEDEPFDLEGTHWKGENLVALPKPLSRPHMPMATASDTPEMIKLAAERGYTLLCAFFESVEMLRRKADLYEDAGLKAGRPDPRRLVAGSRAVYVAKSKAEALSDLRPAVTHEVSLQAERGFLAVLKRVYGVEVPNNKNALDALVDAGIYVLGSPEEVTESLRSYHEGCGGFGSFLLVGGKNWATKEKRSHSLKRFAKEVIPNLAHL